MPIEAHCSLSHSHNHKHNHHPNFGSEYFSISLICHFNIFPHHQAVPLFSFFFRPVALRASQTYMFYALDDVFWCEAAYRFMFHIILEHFTLFSISDSAFSLCSILASINACYSHIIIIFFPRVLENTRQQAWKTEKKYATILKDRKRVYRVQCLM